MLRALLLGEFVLLRDDGTPFSNWRWQTALLAVLARSPGGTVTRSALAALLWPESPEEMARLSLRQALFRTRRAVGEIMSAGGEAVSLDRARVSVDVHEFETLLDAGELTRALELYRGDFLAGFSLPGSPEFNHWADRERVYLTGRAARAFEAHVETLARRGDWSSALEWAGRWLAAVPYSEGAARQLITLHLQEGDRGSALAVYEGFRSRLAKELGVEPGAALESLVDSARRTESRPLVTPAIESTGGALARALPPFVGRAREFEALSARWERARAGRRQLVLVTGEPGIGKTRLVTEFAQRARLSGATVLPGRAYEVEGGAIPYAALVGALRAGLDAPGLAAVDARALGELSRIMPELADRFRGILAPAGDEGEFGRLRLLDAVRTMLDNLAYEAPVLLLLDDLPWSDAATVTVLHHLWRTLPTTPLLLLATARSGDLLPESAAGRLLAALLRDDADDVGQIDLPLLSRAEIRRMVAALHSSATDDPATIVALEEATGGNPLFLVEALRSRTEGDGPIAATTTVRTVVQDRLHRLPPPARELLAAAAVLGRRFPLPTAAGVARLSASEAAEALAHLVDARIVQQVGYAYDFTHDLVRHSVYMELGARRTVLHARTYERLSPAGAEEVGLERAGALAMHAAQGGLREASYRWLLRASELASRAYADVEAERFLEQALSTAEAPGELAEAWERMGDFRRIRSRFVEAGRDYLRALAHAAPGSPERLRLRIRAFDASVRAGLFGPQDIEDIAADLVPEATACGGAPLRELYATLAHAGVQTGDLEAAARHAAATMRAARGGEPQPLVRALLLHARLGVATGALADGLGVQEEAARIAAEHSMTVEQSQAEIEHASELLRLGRWPEAERELEGVLRRAETTGDIGSETTACLNLGDLLMRRGEWDTAEALFRRVDRVGSRFPHLRLYAQLNRALMAWLRGSPQMMVQHAEEVVAEVSTLAFPPVEQVARALLVVGALEAGGRPSEVDIHALNAPDAADFRFWSMDREMITVARARAAAYGGDARAAARSLEIGLAEVRDGYAKALLSLELANLRSVHDPLRVRCLYREAVKILEEFGALPLLERARAAAAQPLDEPAR